MDPWYNCGKQKYQDFSFLKTIVICNTSTISAKCWSIAKGDIFKLVLNIHTHHLVVNIIEAKFIPNFKIYKIHPKHSKQ